MAIATLKDEALDKLKDLPVDHCLIFHLKDGFNAREAHLALIAINTRAERYKIVLRIQKYLHKLYVIRCA